MQCFQIHFFEGPTSPYIQKYFLLGSGRISRMTLKMSKNAEFHGTLTYLMTRETYTVNEDIFALYIFSHNSRFLDIRENMYTLKITFVIAYRANYT